MTEHLQTLRAFVITVTIGALAFHGICAAAYYIG